MVVIVLELGLAIVRAPTAIQRNPDTFIRPTSDIPLPSSSRCATPAASDQLHQAQSRDITAGPRCPTCRLTMNLCYCQDIQSTKASFPVSVLVHIQEMNKQSNTGKLATRCLEDSQCLGYGIEDQPIAWDELVRPNHQPVLLFPYASHTLSKEWVASLERPMHLIVPDGTWRQGNKMARKISMQLPHIKRVALPLSYGTSKYVLRKKKKHDGGLGTMEAIAFAIELIDGLEAARPMYDSFFCMVDRVVAARGKRGADPTTTAAPS